ncbi:hypothetical protein [Arthrobacter sp. KNU40]|uniref:hypothetical protein n=1 Tax=Arthrobacter sp. KNU40 TaxID=3447965 RepID=UPI003F5E2452
MSESVRSYLAQHVTREKTESVRAFLSELPEPDGDVFEVLEEAEDAAARRMQPDLPPFSYLVIKLSGEAVANGGVNHDIANDLLGPIGAEIQAAADRPAQSEMTLVRITRGSLVLHYKPKLPLAPSTEGQVEVDVSPVDQAVRDTFDLHNMLEQGALASVIASRFGDNKRLLKTARKLTEALDKHDLNMSGKWRSPTGGRVQSNLTERGRTYAKGLFQQIDKPKETIVTGRITGLDLDGIVTVQQVRNRKRKVHLEDPADITGSGFVLGAEVSLRVEVVEAQDQVGLSGREHLKYIEHVHQGVLDFPDEATD